VRADAPTPVAVVTGAGSGIGRATAVALAQEGLHVVLVGRRGEALEETAGLLPAGAESVSVPLDVADPASAHVMVTTCLGRFGRVDVLVNNAGTAPLLPIDGTSEETIQRTFMTNAVGPACLIARAWTVFKRQHAEGRMGRLGHCVVNVSTLGTSDPFPGFFAYAASKASLNLMARSCAKEGKGIGVRAFAVAPGAVETAMLRSIFSEKTVPASRCLTPERVAEEIVACVQGERDAQNGGTIYLKQE
jgi:NAD(P)-dependent dehydrogenase (short-subunit alcohol dehydrogenase family)